MVVFCLHKRWVFSCKWLGLAIEFSVDAMIEDSQVIDVLHHWMKLKVPSRLPASFPLEESESLSWWLYWRRKPSALPYLSGWRMDQCGGKVHRAALIRDNHIPYFQVMPHLMADVGRYWLNVFWKPVTEPCREFTAYGGSSHHRAIWEQPCGLDHV